MSELLRRRVPQFVGLYLIGCWGFIEFLDWAVEQYVLSPHIINFFVLLLLLLVPTVVMLAWRHGAPGRDRWTRLEAIGISLNLVVAAVVLYIGFSGKILGAATTTVVIEDPEGNEIERTVPRNEFRRKLILFAFDNESGDPRLDWLEYGIPIALANDLSQDMFLTAIPGWAEGVVERLAEAGFPDGTGVPVTLKREVSMDRHMDYFLAGAVVQDSGGYAVEMELYDAERGRRVARRRLADPDVFELADQISAQLKSDLGLPAYRIDEAPDLPVAEMLTSSAEAFEVASGASRALAINDRATALEKLTAAVELDPTFAAAQANLAFLHLTNNESEPAKEALQAALEHSYRLPERVQLTLRYLDHWLFQFEPERAFSTANYFVEIYPQDIQGHQLLAQYHNVRGDRTAAIAEYEAILTLDPTQYDLLRTIGGLYLDNQKHDQALEYFQRYADRFPEDYRSHTALGALFRQMGDHGQAKAAYERALLAEPEEPAVLGSLARHALDQGDFELAAEYRDRALAASRSPQDSLSVIEFDDAVALRRGQFDGIRDTYYKRRELSARFRDPLNHALNIMGANLLDMGPLWGQQALSLRELDALDETLAPPFDGLLASTYVNNYLWAEDVGNARHELERLRAAIEALGFQIFDVLVAHAEGRIAEIEGDCGAAISYYQEALTLSPAARFGAVALGRCQRAVGELEAAEATLSEILSVIPSSPETRYELALVYEDMGRREAAIAELEAVLDVWADADPEYRPAREARAKLEELRAAD